MFSYNTIIFMCINTNDEKINKYILEKKTPEKFFINTYCILMSLDNGHTSKHTSKRTSKHTSKHTSQHTSKHTSKHKDDLIKVSNII